MANNPNHFLDYNGLLYFWGKLKTVFAAISHSHAISDVTNLQTTLDGKAASSHNHAASDVTSGTLDPARLPVATDSALGAIKVGSNLTITNGVLSADATSYTHPTYTARTGKPTADATPAFGGTVTVSQITSDTLGHVTGATDRTITIPDTAFTGATAEAAGAKGLIPAPLAGDQSKFLSGDGTWKAASFSDQHVDVALATTTKAYILGTSTTPTASGINTTAVADTGVYLDTTAGKLSATSFAGNGANLTNLNASAVSSGTIGASYLPAATQSAQGAMTAADKTKLDGIATGANNYVHPSYTAQTKALYKVAVDATGHVNDVTEAAKSDITALGIPAQDTTYTFATGSTNGTISVTPSDGTASDVAVAGLGDLAYLNSLSKSDVGLGNVDNTADANKTVNKANTLTNTRRIDGVEFDGSADIIHYGSCSVAASSAAKTVSCTGFKLLTGSRILVKFTNGSDGIGGGISLNVNSTGAKAVYYRGSVLGAGYSLATKGVYEFVYDGTQYNLVGELDTNTTYSNATTSTAGLMSASDKTKLNGFSSASDYCLKTDFASAMRYKGTVATVNDLPASDNTIGDMYNVTANNMNYAWDGSAWDPMGGVVSIDPITNAEIDTILAS